MSASSSVRIDGGGGIAMRCSIDRGLENKMRILGSPSNEAESSYTYAYDVVEGIYIVGLLLFYIKTHAYTYLYR